MRRVSVIVQGRVQGVAFRYYTSRRARESGVNGWVRNLPDGSLEARFEGADAAVAELVEWCRSGPPAARVESLEIREETYRSEFSSFSVIE